MKIVSIVGARPQFIKAAAVSRALRTSSGVQELLVHTGQHYDDNMSAVFFRELEIQEPHYNLAVGSGGHGAQTGEMLARIEELLVEQVPDRVLVYGDTNSTLAGALAAAKLHIPVAHVEAGLRSFNRAMPEEINRIVADHVADLLFAPTVAAVDNLQREGIRANSVHLVGDVMYDAALYHAGKAQAQSRILDRLGIERGKYVLATVHRAENTDRPERLEAIFSALKDLAAEIHVVLPLHPRTRKALGAGARPASAAALHLIEPVGYLDMTMLERNARLIVTDSGGVQKEAYFHGVPCATLRTETEWVELVASGWNRLIAPLSARAVLKGLRETLGAGRPSAHVDLYGSGRAAQAIATALAA
jgi:UDP-GlcNAc3NAcA epimerase